MLDRFASFSKTSPSPSAPTTEGIDLSDGEKLGLLLYPHTADDLEASAGGLRGAARASGRGRGQIGAHDRALASQAREDEPAAGVAEGPTT